MAQPVYAQQMDDYKARIRNLSGQANWCGVDAFKTYFSRHPSRCRTRLSIVDFPNHSGTIDDIVDPCPCSLNHSRVLDLLSESSQPDCRLYIVESPCPEMIALLGGNLDIDPLFWVEHLDVLPWHRTDEDFYQDPRLILPSTRLRQPYLHLRTIQSRDKQKSDTDSIRSYVYEDESILRPVVAKQRKFATVVLTRQRFTSWFKKTSIAGGDPKQASRSRWRGVIAFEPEFQPTTNEKCKDSQFLNFWPRTGAPGEPLDDPPRSSFFSTFKYYLRNSMDDQRSGFSEAAVSDCFLVLIPAYRIVAAEWQLTNAYLNRELATIELALEQRNSKGEDAMNLKEQGQFLERNSKDLFSIRQRCAKYLEWVADAQNQSRLRGQPSWPKESVVNSQAQQEAEILLGDFDAVQSSFQATLQRADKCLEFVPTLVTIVDGKIGLQQNVSISKLTVIGVVLALVLTPLSTVSAILAIPGPFSVVDGDRSYLVFVVSFALGFPLLLLTLNVDGLTSMSMRTLAQVRSS